MECSPAAQRYFNNLFMLPDDFDWTKIYDLPRKTTVDTRLRMFQYKILNNVLYLNENVFKDYVSLANLSPQSATLGFTSNTENSILINHIVLLFK